MSPWVGKSMDRKRNARIRSRFTAFTIGKRVLWFEADERTGLRPEGSVISNDGVRVKVAWADGAIGEFQYNALARLVLV